MKVIITESYNEKQWMMGLVGEAVELGLIPKIRVPDANNKDHFINGSECWWDQLPDELSEYEVGMSIPITIFGELVNQTDDTKQMFAQIVATMGSTKVADLFIKYTQLKNTSQLFLDGIHQPILTLIDELFPTLHLEESRKKLIEWTKKFAAVNALKYNDKQLMIDKSIEDMLKFIDYSTAQFASLPADKHREMVQKLIVHLSILPFGAELSDRHLPKTDELLKMEEGEVASKLEIISSSLIFP